MTPSESTTVWVIFTDWGNRTSSANNTSTWVTNDRGDWGNRTSRANVTFTRAARANTTYGNNRVTNYMAIRTTGLTNDRSDWGNRTYGYCGVLG
jgi:hypothetical protein